MMNELWVTFGLSAMGVIIAGTLIGRLTGEIGERLHLGRAWSGAVLLAFATSLPELVTTVTLALRGAVGMAIGGILGSIVFNLFILVFVDVLDRKPLYHRISMNHLATGLLGCALLGILITGIASGFALPDGAAGFGLAHLDATSLALFSLYGLGQYALFQLARSSFTKDATMHVDTAWNRVPLKLMLLAYAGLGTVILISAYHLGIAAEGLAQFYGLGAIFAGAVLLGIVTSLPEIANALSCAKQQEYDLAVGNILGANVFVMLALVIADACFLDGRLFSFVTQREAMSSIAMAGLAIVMHGIVLGALAIRSQHQIWRVSVTSVLLAALYAASLILAYAFAT